MEIAFTILGLGALDAVITGVLKEAKQQNKIIFVRISMYLTVAIIVLVEVSKLINYARMVFGI
ncbi:hypothetical protein A8709_33130 [Paenibacillus pectinilyticus]|uniref:Stage III sporulation protein AC n=1 Tax=Paenibacillus pectinilyticus TaxID=512399 RepID=A0A1C0ZX29_9BACL|nr:hypothetical protein [Paenibacillus pectinilyticus]OCT12655.1 hypothetical protein A8709_33130 [Paenibacillus pectinilyticus]